MAWLPVSAVMLDGCLGRYERAHAKLVEVTNNIEASVHARVRVALRVYFETKILPFGAVQRIGDDGFVLPVAEVPALLDEYRWAKDAKRDHVTHLLTMVLRAMAEFRTPRCDQTARRTTPRATSRLDVPWSMMLW